MPSFFTTLPVPVLLREPRLMSDLLGGASSTLLFCRLLARSQVPNKVFAHPSAGTKVRDVCPLPQAAALPPQDGVLRC